MAFINPFKLHSIREEKGKKEAEEAHLRIVLIEQEIRLLWARLNELAEKKSKKVKRG